MCGEYDDATTVPRCVVQDATARNSGGRSELARYRIGAFGALARFRSMTTTTTPPHNDKRDKLPLTVTTDNPPRKSMLGPLLAVVALLLSSGGAHAHPFTSPAATSTATPPLTGCTPSGLSYVPTGADDAGPILYPASETTPGWCFERGRLVAPHALAIHAAFAGGASDVVDVSAATAFCAQECGRDCTTTSHCAAFVIRRLAKIVRLSPWPR